MIGAAVTSRQFRASLITERLNYQPALAGENICGYSSAPINLPAYVHMIARRQVFPINVALSIGKTLRWKNYRRCIFEVRFNPHWLIATCINVYRDIISLKKELPP